MSLPNTLIALKNYVWSLDSFPVNRSTSVRYGLSDSPALPFVEFGDYKLTAPEWTTCGPAMWVSDFQIECFAKTQAEAYSLASTVNDLFNQQQVTPDTFLCEFVSLELVQEDNYRFHARLTYKLQENPPEI